MYLLIYTCLELHFFLNLAGYLKFGRIISGLMGFFVLFCFVLAYLFYFETESQHIQGWF